MALRLEASEAVGSIARARLAAFGEMGVDRDWEIVAVDPLFCPHERVGGVRRGTGQWVDCVDCGSFIATT